jgi:hypothetical protein
MERHGTISNAVMRNILSKFGGEHFMTHLRACMPGGSVRMNQTTGDIYWNSGDIDPRTGKPNQHLSFHTGGSHNARGSIHLVYNDTVQGRAVTIRIYIYPMAKEWPPDEYGEWESYGNYIWIDKTNIYRIENDIDKISCDQLINDIGLCLSGFLDFLIDEMRQGSGKRRTRKPRRKIRRKPRKTSRK